MKKAIPTYPRMLGLAPSSRGFGFALVEGLDVLADWGVKSVTGDKNAGSMARVQALIAHYEPDVIVLENTSTKPFHRSARIRTLSKQIVALAERHGITVRLFSRDEVRQNFLADGQGTKHALAEMVATTFPEELGFRLPPKRRPWMSEDYRMAIFDAIALALMCGKRTKRATEST